MIPLQLSDFLSQYIQQVCSVDNFLYRTFFSLSSRSGLHTCPKDSALSFQTLSKSMGLDKYQGKRENKVCFNSSVGSAGSFPNPITVHWARTYSPKKDSQANSTPLMPTLLSCRNFGYGPNVCEVGIRLVLLIVEDIKAEVFAFSGIRFALVVVEEDDDSVNGRGDLKWVVTCMYWLKLFTKFRWWCIYQRRLKRYLKWSKTQMI